MGFDIEAQNLDHIQQNLEKVADSLKNNKLVADAALLAEEQMRTNASGRPGPNIKRHQLLDSIKTDMLDKNTALVGPHTPYAGFVEFGHPQHPGQYVPAIGRRLVADFVQPYPYVEPVVDQIKDKVEGVSIEFLQGLGAQWMD